MDFSAEGILDRMRSALKNEDTRIEGSFSMDNLQAVAEELARFNEMRIIPLTEILTEKEEDMGTSGNERHYIRWAKAAVDKTGKKIVGNAKVSAPRDGTGYVSIAILTMEAKPPTPEQIQCVQEYINTMRPIGANPIVLAATSIPITITVSVRGSVGYSEDAIKKQIKKAIEGYFTQIAFESGTPSLNYYTLCNIANTEGVKELEDMEVNGEKNSITADYNKYFSLEELMINVIAE